MPLSPKTESLMQMPAADQEGQIFEQQFSEMAQGMLLNKYPQLAQQVATFKVIDSDLDTGSAVGAFIVQFPSGMIYIPVVLSENQLKPLEICYDQQHDAFLPLSPQWLEEVQRNTVDIMGEAVKTPSSLYTDVDIRNLVVPPTTGRYSYASATDLKLPDFLRKAEKKVRQKFAEVLKSDVGLLKTAVAIYGYQTLAEALNSPTEKTAAEEAPVTSTEALSVVTRRSAAKDFKDIFGDEAPIAMRGVAVKGYYTKDTRKNLKRPVDEETPVKLEEIKSSGAYRLTKTDGSTVTALVFHRPSSLRSHGDEMKYDKFVGPTEQHKHHSNYLVVTSDGAVHRLDCCVMGEPIDIGELTGKAKSVAQPEGKGVSTGRGFLARHRGDNLEATLPLEIKSVSTGSDGIKRAKAFSDSYSDITLVFDEKSGLGRITKPNKDGVVMVPSDFRWVPAESESFDSLSNPYIKDPLSALRGAGSKPLTVKKAGVDDYFIAGTGFSGSQIRTTLKLATDFHISVPDAEAVIKLADERGSARVLLADAALLSKLAEGEKKDKPKDPKKKTTVTEEPAMDPMAQAQMQGGGAPGQEGAPPPGAEGDPMAGGMDPAAMGGDPAAMGGAMPPPAPPSPTDQAVAELQEEVSRAHEEQMKLLQHKLDALQMVAQRTEEIVQGVPKEQSQAIQQAVSTAAQGAPQAAAPAPVGEQGAAPMPVDPSAAAPGAQGQMQGQMDPAAQGPVDPSMMQQASGLQDPEMFDAAAIGSLSEHSSLKDLISSYMPTLEKSVDHIGRILLTTWMKGDELKQEMGETNYSNLEDRLRNMFRGMGDVVLKLNKDSLMLKDDTAGLVPNESA